MHEFFAYNARKPGGACLEEAVFVRKFDSSAIVRNGWQTACRAAPGPIFAGRQHTDPSPGNLLCHVRPEGHCLHRRAAIFFSMRTALEIVMSLEGIESCPESPNSWGPAQNHCSSTVARRFLASHCTFQGPISSTASSL